MSGCEIGIAVVDYLVLVSAVVDLIAQRRITRRLDRIDRLLAPAAKESLSNGNNVADSEGKKGKRLEERT